MVTTEGPNTALRRLADRHDSFSVFCRDVFLYIEELRSKSNLHQHVVHLFEQLHVFLRQFRARGVQSEPVGPWLVDERERSSELGGASRYRRRRCGNYLDKSWFLRLPNRDTAR